MIAATQVSSQQPEAEAGLEEWLSALAEAEGQDFLLKLVRREPHVAREPARAHGQAVGAAR